jgi:hypothetical protein
MQSFHRKDKDQPMGAIYQTHDPFSGAGDIPESSPESVRGKSPGFEDGVNPQ